MVFRRAIGRPLEVIGAVGGFDQFEQPSQYAVFVQQCDAIESLDDLCVQRLAVAARLRIEALGKELHQQPRRFRMLEQRVADELLFEAEQRLLHVTRVRAQDDDLTPLEAADQHEPVQRIIVGRAVPDAHEGFFEPLGYPRDVDRPSRAQFEVVDRNRARAAVDSVRLFADRAHAHVFERGNQLRQRQRLAEVEHAGEEHVFRIFGAAVEPHRQVALLAQPLHVLNVGHRRAR